MSDAPFGREKGEPCNRPNAPHSYGGCEGIIDEARADDCSCHVAPPCGACVAGRHFCPVCDWHEKDEASFNDHVIHVDPKTQIWKSFELRKLDPTKIDWHTLCHTHFTQRARGVYPPGTTQDEVRKLVNGTFGGRFERFDNGHFDFVAYTD